jgi:hypothetical protein
MILNLDDYPSLSLLPITADELYYVINTNPAHSRHPFSENVWEHNTTYNFEDCTCSVEVLIRVQESIGQLWLTINARRQVTENDQVAFLILSVTESRVYIDTELAHFIQAL